MTPRMPKGLDHKPGLQMAFGAFVFLGLIATGLGRCNRAQQADARAELQKPLADIVVVGSISVGTLVQGTLEAGEREAWTLTGTKGQRIAVALFSAWDNSVAVLRPDSEWNLVEDGFSGGNGQGLIDGTTLPADGSYRIVVRGENGGAGNYELTVTEAPPATPGTITTVGPGDAPILITR